MQYANHGPFIHTLMRGTYAHFITGLSGLSIFGFLLLLYTREMCVSKEFNYFYCVHAYFLCVYSA